MKQTLLPSEIYRSVQLYQNHVQLSKIPSQNGDFGCEILDIRSGVEIE